MDSCFVTEFPRNIGMLSRLEEIHATWCVSMEGPIPNDIRKIKHIRILRLRNSKISNLPAKIQQLSSLQNLDLLQCDVLQDFLKLPSSLTVLHVNPRLWKIIGYSQPTKSISMVQPPQLPRHRTSYERKMAKPPHRWSLKKSIFRFSIKYLFGRVFFCLF